MRLVMTVLLCGAMAFAQSRTYPIMTTIAGGNPSSFDNNGSTIENTPNVQGVAVDRAGNVYFGEFFEGNVRRVNSGLYPGFAGINTVAGSGYPDFFQVGDLFNGNGLQATLAPIAQPQRFAFDSSGNLHFLDVGNGTVNRINPDGTLTILAGMGSGADAPSGDGGPANQAVLVNPRALAIDKATNTIYVSDNNGLIIRKIANGIITTIAGNGNPGFSGDSGPAANATFSRVSGLAVDGDGTLYLAADNRVRAIGSNGIIRTVAGTGAGGVAGDGGFATAAAIGGARTLAFDGAGNLYVCEGSGSARIRKIDSNGIITTVAGGGTQPPPAAALSAQLLSPDDIGFDSAGRLYITDGTLNEVLEVDSDGFMSVLVLTTQPSYPNAKSARFLGINSIAVDPQGRIYVADQKDGRFWTVNPDGSLQVLYNAGRNNPVKVGADASGNVYIGVGASLPNGSAALNLMRVTPGGSTVLVAKLPVPTGQYSGGGMAFDSSGNIYVSAGTQVFRVTPGGTATVVAGNGNAGSSGDGGPATSAQLTLPSGVAIKGDGTLYIADAEADAVRFVTPDGIIHTLSFTVAGLTHQADDYLNDVAVDAAGNVYIGDGGNDHVYIVTPAGAARLYAGTFGPYGGDGLPADIASLADVDGLAIDSAGNLYVGDNWSVRKISSGTLNQ